MSFYIEPKLISPFQLNFQSCRSPVMFKFDDPHQSCLQQHHRKDSTSSEVAAFLCISGRTSRISSVGSQGSAASRLSAISGVSRSPSPHRMLLETSFCGPKPLDNNLVGGLISNIESPASELLEQVLLARKHDPTQAILAEGIKIDTSSLSSPQKSNVGNGDGPIKRKSLELSQKMPEVKITKPTGTAVRQVRKPIGKKEVCKPIIGINPSGTEYYRIKLKPDHMYKDNGLGENEKIIDATSNIEVRKKPGTLNLKGQTDDQITKHPDQKLVPSASPKPARHIALSRDLGSRSPSPATVTVSRKSSFCSLFKSKDTIASPESPRERSRSKSREGGQTSQSGTPSKQKSVLAIFKPKKTGSKSKSTSPIEPEPISSGADSLSQVEFRFESSQSCVNDSRSRSRSRLRYYDTPLDGKSIHIPLHTPPDEKDDFKITKQTTAATATAPPPPPQPTSFTQTVPNEISNKNIKPKPPKIQSVQKSYRIENPDGSITIPLHSPTDERDLDLWSKDIQRHSSQESQETVISSHITSTDENALSKTRKTEITQPLKSPTQQQQKPQIKNDALTPITPPIIQPPPSTPIQIQPPTTTRDKKHILFCTRIGSGSEEQIFSTQFSLSKTESLNSQLSEHTTSVFDSPTGSEIKENGLQRNDTVIKRDESPATYSAVILRKKNSFDESKRKSKVTEPITLQQELSAAVEIVQGKLAKEEVINTNRHSRYIENIDEIMEEQRKLQENLIKQKELRKSDDELSPPTTSQEDLHQKPDPVIEEIPKPLSPIPVSPHPPPLHDRNSMASSDYLGSSESERESENDSTRVKRHLPRNMGTIDDHESTGLVSQDSYDDELPYVPITLPEERTIGIALVPIKERAYMDLKMCPVERPRSTTPINPSSLEEYCGTILTDDNDNLPIRGEKLRISLPRRDSKDRLPKSSKSPRRISNASGKSWFEFAEHGIKGTVPTAEETACRRGSGQEEDPPPPPLPPRKSSSTTITTTTTNQWINFEDIPEKRKPPKRITLLPGKENSPAPTQETSSHQVQYNYVNPDECSCECHESEREISNTRIENNVEEETEQAPSEDTQPLLEPDLGDCIDRTSIIR